MAISLHTGEGGLQVVRVENDEATAEITLLGAHVISYIPKGGEEIMWMSPKCVFAEGTGIRGGVPICWPWFGKKFGISHGLVRRFLWKYLGSKELSHSESVVQFSIDDSEETRKVWDYKFHLTMKITVGKTLRMDLTTENKDERPMELSQALHTYFRISDVANLKICGFENKSYFDKVNGANDIKTVGDGPVQITSEVDRVFQNAPGPFRIVDAGLKREIVITTENSNSAVIWNPWIDKSTTMADFPADGYLTMVCVETCNAMEDTRTIAPGASHTLTSIYTVNPL